MKKRPNGFLAVGQDPEEVLDYVRELHDYLWRFVRVPLPWASGTLDHFIDQAIEELEAKEATDVL